MKVLGEVKAIDFVIEEERHREKRIIAAEDV